MSRGCQTKKKNQQITILAVEIAYCFQIIYSYIHSITNLRTIQANMQKNLTGSRERGCRVMNVSVWHGRLPSHTLLPQRKPGPNGSFETASSSSFDWACRWNSGTKETFPGVRTKQHYTSWQPIEWANLEFQSTYCDHLFEKAPKHTPSHQQYQEQH